MQIEQLGYLGINSTSPQAFSDYATGILGLQAVHGERGRSYFRMDDFEQRIIIEHAETDGGAYYGWQLADSAAVAALADRVERGGVAVHEATPEELEVRKVGRMVHFADPSGHRVELYCDPARTGASFDSPRGLPGFVAGDLGLGHVVLLSDRLEESQRFYTDVLGFRLSDYMNDKPFSASFMRTNPRHHSLAIADATFFNAPNALHHFMLEVHDPDEVGRSWDMVLEKDVPVTMSLGKHTNDQMFSFYVQSPAGVHTEFGAGGVLVDEDTWQVCEMPGPDIWGHLH
ncbi:VOC family protein [Streptosporangium carneum]|uniref:Iron-dependent extradiol dioxygenase n=1 Tax=Streptosporangium carneum TaxID=47481 RepID=A0A9W6MBI5_9ACTN|nr:VOC family protein [Streptosporangium carneum]GLK08364.1 iron-dependent extradiol dioxygenase [Streptosporangium carneum]